MSLASEIHKKVLSLFQWAPDSAVFNVPEYWKSFEEDVRAGRSFRGDCDDFALTCAVLAVEDYNVPKEQIELCFVQVETGEYHLVCSIGSEVLDNRCRVIQPKRDALYKKWISGMNLDEKTWRKYAII